MKKVSETMSGNAKNTSADARLHEISKVISNFKYESSTVIQAIVSVSEMHMGTENLSDRACHALAKINEQGKMLAEISCEALTRIEELATADQGEFLLQRNLPQKKRRETTERHVVPLRMPYGSVMIVDDLELNLTVTKGLLEFYEINVETTRNAQTVIDKVSSGVVYDLILMDLMMPDIDGITAMRTLRKLGYAMPIIAFTANSSPENDVACIKQGFDAVLGKPIQVPELDDILHKFVRNRKSRQTIDEAEETERDGPDELEPIEDKAKSRGCILLVGEDVDMLGSVARVLSRFYIVKATRKAEDAISIAIKYNVDLILLDMSITTGEGYKILDEIKSNEQVNKLPVIVISKDSMLNDEAKALVGGAVDYLRQPISDDILTLRVELHMSLLKQMRDIEQLGLVDSLTGINNRRSYNIVFDNEWKRAARTRQHLSLLMIDIDHFKRFNDTHGHLCGDEVLKSMAKILVASVKRGSDYVFRWGGEEFAVILPNTPIEGAYHVAESIRTNIENSSTVYEGNSYKITVSIGTSSVIPDCSTVLSDSFLFRRSVDKALYSAKEQGRNRVVKLAV